VLDGPDWVDGQLIDSGSSGLQFRLPPELPPLYGGGVRNKPGVIRSPYSNDKKAELEFPPSQWSPGSELECPVTHRKFLFQNGLPSGWKMSAVPVAMVPGNYLSPYGKGAQVTIPPEACRPGATYICPETGWEFDLPIAAGHPGLDVEKAILDETFKEPTADAAGLAEGLAASGIAVGAAQVSSIWQAHELSDLAERETRLVRVAQSIDPVARTVESPWQEGEMVSPKPGDWRPGGLINCSGSGRKFKLPPKIPTFELREAEIAVGVITSPYDSRESIKVEPASWIGSTRLKCPSTDGEIVLPDTLPEWVPEVEIDEPGLAKSPFDGKSFAVSGDKWRPGAELVDAGGKRCRIQADADLPALVGVVDKAIPWAVRSPYVKATGLDDRTGIVEILPVEWESGALRPCPDTGIEFKLPVETDLPTWQTVGRADPNRPGVVFSPHVSGHEITVPAAKWEAGTTVSCGESGKDFTLPSDLPPLDAIVLEPGAVASPFDTNFKPIVKPDQWFGRAEIRCGTTGRMFRIPDEAKLPHWAPPAKLVSGSPQMVNSPFAGKDPFKVDGTQWKAGTEVPVPSEEGEPVRMVRLPDGLPNLSAEYTSEMGRVRSPYAPAGQGFVHVELKDWLEGFETRCPATGLTFFLSEPPEWLIDAHLESDLGIGEIRSPFDLSRKKFSVSHQNWKPGAIVECPTTRRRFQMPADVANVTPVAIIDPKNPGMVECPLCHTGAFKIRSGQWKGNSMVSCKHSGQPLLLPADLPQRVRKKIPLWPFVLIGLVAASAIAMPMVKKALAARNAQPELNQGGDSVEPKVDPSTEVDQNPIPKDPDPNSESVAEATLPDAPLVLPLPPAPTFEQRMTGQGEPVDRAEFLEWLASNPTDLGRIVALGGSARTAARDHLLSGIRNGSLQPRELAEIASALPSEFVEPVVDSARQQDDRNYLKELVRGGGMPVHTAILARLVAVAVEAKPGEIINPITKENETIPWTDWEPDKEIRETGRGRLFKLPSNLPVPVATGARAADQQGLGQVISPFTRTTIGVPGTAWKPGEKITQEGFPSPFALPKKGPLPDLLGVVVAQDRPGKIKSPYDGGKEQDVQKEAWKPGEVVRCLATNRTFLLPTGLPTFPEEPIQPDIVKNDGQNGDTVAEENSADDGNSPKPPTKPKVAPGVKGDYVWENGAWKFIPLIDAVPDVPKKDPRDDWANPDLKSGTLATNVRVGSDGRPYATNPFTGKEWPIKASSWKSGAEITDSASGRKYVLPDKLPQLRQATPKPDTTSRKTPPTVARNDSGQTTRTPPRQEPKPPPVKESSPPPSGGIRSGTVPNSHKFMAKGFRSSAGVEMKAVKGSNGVYFKSFSPSRIKQSGANSITTRDRAAGVIPPGWSYRSSGGHLYLVP